MSPTRLLPRSPLARVSSITLLALLALVAVLVIRTISASREEPTSPISFREVKFDAGLAAQHLGAAVRLQTISVDGQPDASAAALAAFRDWLIETYPNFHAQARRTLAGSGTLIYEWPGGNSALKPIVLMAHQDVVPAPDAPRWKHPPFSGAIDDGAIWGRGSIDDKGSLITIMEAAEALAMHGYSPKRTIILVIGHDEETSGSGAKAAAELLASRGVKVEFVLDEGSLAIKDYPVISAPVALIGISEKGYATFRVTATASGGHSSSPPPESAVGTLSRAIEAITSQPFPERYDGATRAMLEALSLHAPMLTRMAIANSWLFKPILVSQIGASPPGAAMLHTTIAPTMLKGSPKENVLPTSASAVFNIRIAPGDTVASVTEHLQRAMKGLPVKLELVGENHNPSGVSSIDLPAYKFISGVARELFGIPVAPAPVIAATDSRSMERIATNIYRFQPVMLTLEETEMIHGIDEHLSVEALSKMIRFYIAMMTEE